MLDWDADGAEAKAEKEEKADELVDGAAAAAIDPFALLCWVMDESNAGPGMANREQE